MGSAGMSLQIEQHHLQTHTPQMMIITIIITIIISIIITITTICYKKRSEAGAVVNQGEQDQDPTLTISAHQPPFVQGCSSHSNNKKYIKIEREIIKHKIRNTDQLELTF